MRLQPEGRQLCSHGIHPVESGRPKTEEPPQGATEQFDDDDEDDDEDDLRRCAQLIWRDKRLCCLR